MSPSLAVGVSTALVAVALILVVLVVRALRKMITRAITIPITGAGLAVILSGPIWIQTLIRFLYTETGPKAVLVDLAPQIGWLPTIIAFTFWAALAVRDLRHNRKHHGAS